MCGHYRLQDPAVFYQTQEYSPKTGGWNSVGARMRTGGAE